MSEMLRVEVLGVPELLRIFGEMKGARIRRAVSRAVGELLIKQLREYPPYRHVSRKAAYGRSFQSDAQRKWFFAALRSGGLSVPYSRTQALAGGWRMINDTQIVNSAAYGPYMMSPTRQTRMAQLQGWPTTIEVVRLVAPAAEKVARATYADILRGLV